MIAEYPCCGGRMILQPPSRRWERRCPCCGSRWDVKQTSTFSPIEGMDVTVLELQDMNGVAFRLKYGT